MIEQLQAEARQAVHSMENAQSTASEGMERVREAALALHSMIQHVERMNQLNAETLKNMQMQVEVSRNVSAGVESISGHSYQSADTACPHRGNFAPAGRYGESPQHAGQPFPALTCPVAACRPPPRFPLLSNSHSQPQLVAFSSSVSKASASLCELPQQ